MRPNPSLERTSTGLALGPRGAQAYHPPRGPSAIPASARSAQTLGVTRTPQRARHRRSSTPSRSTSLNATRRRTVCQLRQSWLSGKLDATVVGLPALLSRQRFALAQRACAAAIATRQSSLLCDARARHRGRLLHSSRLRTAAICSHSLQLRRRWQHRSSRSARACRGVSAQLLVASAALDRAAVTPNPSLERTSTGMALGPRGARCHHPPRGPSAIPAPAPQLKR